MGLKDFRRSLNKDRISAPSSRPPAALAKPGSAIAPPKKVIRALQDYRARAPHELSFVKGDFFYVNSDPRPGTDPTWYEACNPVTGARGLVPAAHFEELGRNVKGTGLPSPLPLGSFGAPPVPVGAVAAPPLRSPSLTGTPAPGRPGGGLYAVVQYDFNAERADELDARAGEPIIVIAQSNFEWFVAKPIGRLGGPGLIPVSFVEIQDLSTGRPVDNVEELIRSEAIPKVEEWKKMTADYKKNTIPLGRFEFGMPEGQPSPGVANSPFQQQQLEQQQQQHLSLQPPPGSYGGAPDDMPPPTNGNVGAADLPPGIPPAEPLPVGVVKRATVDSFHFEQGDYWFRIQAFHVSSEPPPDEGTTRDLVLYRLYEDFYEFQIALLDAFPAEAGREPMQEGEEPERILPLMPGPVDHVDDLITAERRADLDTYIQDLVALPDYILRSELLRLFFEPRPGDHCTVHPPGDASQARIEAVEAEVAEQQQRRQQQLQQQQQQQQMQVLDANGTSKYSEEAPVGPSSSGTGGGGYRSGAEEDEYGAGEPNGSVNGHYTSGARSSSGRRSSGGVGQDYRSSSGGGGGGGGGGLAANGAGAAVGAGGGAGGLPPFIKIKIFHRKNDDLIAIRVPPNVTYAALLAKIKDRLGDDVEALRYRDDSGSAGGGGNQGMVRVTSDAQLRSWVLGGSKLVLYADAS